MWFHSNLHFMKPKKLTPPKQAEKFLKWFIQDELAEEVMGDLEERFYVVLEKKSLSKAKLNYWYQVFHYLRPFAIKNIHISPLNPFYMWQHNFKITLRFFLRNKIAFLINLIGLASGLACSLFIYLWVMDELSFDQFHQKHGMPYQVLRNFHGGNQISTGGYNPGPLANALAAEMPEVVRAASATVFMKQQRTLSVEDRNFKVEGCFAGKDFFHIFSFELIAGAKNNALITDKDIVISENLATKLYTYPDSALGKALIIDHVQDFVVTGVFANPPKQSSIQFDFAFSYDAYFKKSKSMQAWTNYNTGTFLTLKEGTDITQFNQKIENFLKQKSAHQHSTIFVRPFADGYLYNRYENGVLAGGRIGYVRLFTLLALFILIVACINFMNLSTAKASKRLQEVGVKKVIGATRKSLIYQYLGESTLLSFLSLIVAFSLVALFMPQFNEITGKHLVLDFSLSQLLPIIGISLLTGVLAGSYPAFYLSGFKPISILRNSFGKTPGALGLRKGLVVFQFALSVTLIVAVGVISQQINLIQTKNLGYDRDNVIQFSVEGNARDSISSLLSEVKRVPGVKSAAGIRNGFFSFYSTIEVEWEGKNPHEIFDAQYRLVDYGLLETLGIKMAMGRAFSQEFGTDKSGIIFNETAIKVMKLEDPIGKPIKVWGYDFEVLGVAKDFNYRSLRHEIEPLFFIMNDSPRNIVAKIQAGTAQTTIHRLQELYEAFNPGFIFDYRFMDDDYQAMYESEMRISTLSRYFAGLAVLISCLGLFGLAAFTAERRTKEIGIRKVLGASAWGIVSLLSKDFTRMVVLGIIIAVPVSYFIAQNWLTNFEYSIDLSWQYFVGAGLLALLIAWITVGTQAFKAAISNPVASLRSE